MIQKLFLTLLVLGVAAAADTCAPDCADGDVGLYPNPQDCSKFYQCSGGNAIEENCPPGLEFNPTAKVCDYPATAGCTADPDLDCGGSASTPGVTSSISVTTLRYTTTTTEAAPTTTETTTTEAAPTTTEKTSTTTEAVTTTLQAASTTIEQVTTTEAQAVTTTLPPISTTPDASSGGPFDCFPPCPSNTAIYANPRDCNTYFMCFGNIPYLMTCNPGDEYNPATETCEEAGSFQCTAGPDQPCVAVTVSPSDSKLT